jgi:hypothetical protein
MKKIIILMSLILLIVCTICTGCTGCTYQGTYTVETYTDEETEKEYLIVISEHGVSITPRLR